MSNILSRKGKFNIIATCVLFVQYIYIFNIYINSINFLSGEILLSCHSCSATCCLSCDQCFLGGVFRVIPLELQKQRPKISGGKPLDTSKSKIDVY